MEFFFFEISKSVLFLRIETYFGFLKILNISWVKTQNLTWCSGSRHPSSLPIKGAGRAQVSTPPAP